MDTKTIIIIAVTAVLFSALSWFVHDCATPKPPRIEAKPQTSTSAVPDSERANIYAEGLTDGISVGKASVLPVVKRVTVQGETRTEIVYDEASRRRGDSLEARIDSMIHAGGDADLVAHDVIELPNHSIEAFYHIAEHSFRDTKVTCTKPDSMQTVEKCPDDTWLESAWKYVSASSFAVVVVAVIAAIFVH